MFIPPHGNSELLPRLLSGAALESECKRAQSLRTIQLSSRAFGDLIMLGLGGFTPLDGFMNHADWQRVCLEMKLTSGLFWPIPITVSVHAEEACALKEGLEVALVFNQNIIATLKIIERYCIDKALECESIFKTKDPQHPGVLGVFKQGEINLAGPVQVLSLGPYQEAYPNLFLSPSETRKIFEQKQWKTIAAFQTRNPMHRAHEYLAKIALECCDGLLIHSVLGQLKTGDIPAPIRIRAIQTLVKHYFPEQRVLQAGYPLDMRYAGPREALLHALFRQNYGCTHLIIGRDHAGIGQYYGPYDAQHIFNEIPKDALQIKPLQMDAAFWCYRCDGMATSKTCPHDGVQHLLLSGTEFRRKMEWGEKVPLEFSRPEVVAVLKAYYRGAPY